MLNTKINGLNSRYFGSQGQQRSIALIMKLSQAQILLEETGEFPEGTVGFFQTITDAYVAFFNKLTN